MFEGSTGPDDPAAMLSVNHENIIGFNIGTNASAWGTGIGEMVFSCCTDRAVMVLVFKAIKVMTDAAKNGCYKSFYEALKLEEEFAHGNKEIGELLTEASHGTTVNNNFRASTGLSHMVPALQNMVRWADDVDVAVDQARKNMRPKIVRYFKKRGVMTPLTDMQHCGESGRRLRPMEVLGFAAHVGKNPIEFSDPPPFVKSSDPLPSFIFPRYECIGTAAYEKFYRVTFGTSSNPQMTKHNVRWG